MISRFDAEKVLSSLVGGAVPGEGDGIRRGSKGWEFFRLSYLGVLNADPSNPEEGDLWYNSTDNKLRIKTNAGVFETAAWTLKL